jgi:hypothetical protein
VTRDSLPNSAFVYESTNAGVAELLSPSIGITTGSAQLVFRNFYNLEMDPALIKAYDGGVLEIKIGSGAFTDILGAGGGFASGGYNRTIDPTDDNPLDGRQCWSGLSPGFITSVVNLPAAAAGKNIQLKWRLGTDTANGYGQGGWYIDAIQILDGYACCTGAAPSIVTQPAGQTVPSGNDATFSVSATGSLPLVYQWTFNGTNLAAATASTLTVTNVQLAQSGLYQVLVTNALGSVTSAPAVLRVLVPPIISLASSSGATNVSVTLTSVSGLNYELQYKSSLAEPAWTPLPPALGGDGGPLVLQDTNPPVLPSRFYRVICY